MFVSLQSIQLKINFKNVFNLLVSQFLSIILAPDVKYPETASGTKYVLVIRQIYFILLNLSYCRVFILRTVTSPLWVKSYLNLKKTVSNFSDFSAGA